MTTLFTRVKPILYTNLHNHLLTNEFLHKFSLQPNLTTPLLLTLSQPPSTLPSQCHSWPSSNNYNQNFSYRGCFCEEWKNNNCGHFNPGGNGYNSSHNLNSNGSDSSQFFGKQFGQ